MTEDAPRSGVTVIYDGECPLCRRYTRMLALREAVGPVRLLDARQGGPEVEEVRRAGLDLDEGMALIVDGTVWHGADAMHRLALMSTTSTVFNRFNRAVFGRPRLSRALYPALRRGRLVLLRLLGRKPIGADPA